MLRPMPLFFYVAACYLRQLLSYFIIIRALLELRGMTARSRFDAAAAACHARLITAERGFRRCHSAMASFKLFAVLPMRRCEGVASLEARAQQDFVAPRRDATPRCRSFVPRCQLRRAFRYRRRKETVSDKARLTGGRVEHNGARQEAEHAVIS